MSAFIVSGSVLALAPVRVAGAVPAVGLVVAVLIVFSSRSIFLVD
jgi:hypothetical protein